MNHLYKCRICYKTFEEFDTLEAGRPCCPACKSHDIETIRKELTGELLWKLRGKFFPQQPWAKVGDDVQREYNTVAEIVREYYESDRNSDQT